MERDEQAPKKSYFKEIIFISVVAGTSLLAGFGMTVSTARKKDPSGYQKALSTDGQLFNEGVQLASRALGRATLYSVTGFSVFTILVYQILRFSGFDIQSFKRSTKPTSIEDLPFKLE